MTKVYVVYGAYYDDWDIEHIYTSEEEAKKLRDKLKNELPKDTDYGYYIMEGDLD